MYDQNGAIEEFYKCVLSVLNFAKKKKKKKNLEIFSVSLLGVLYEKKNLIIISLKQSILICAYALV